MFAAPLRSPKGRMGKYRNNKSPGIKKQVRSDAQYRNWNTSVRSTVHHAVHTLYEIVSQTSRLLTLWWLETKNHLPGAGTCRRPFTWSRINMQLSLPGTPTGETEHRPIRYICLHRCPAKPCGRLPSSATLCTTIQRRQCILSRMCRNNRFSI
jgi:hypothetical protein